MKLYFSPGACSVAPHIVLEEIGAPYEAVKVDLAKKTCAEGDYKQINPKGSVPAIQTDQKELLTENAVILQYLAELKPSLGLIPPPSTLERFRLMETLHFIATELHKGFAPLFQGERLVQNKEGLEQLKTATKEQINKKFALLDEKIQDQDFVMGKQFTIADAYLVTVLRWAHAMKLDSSSWPHLKSYYERMLARPSVHKVFATENLH